MQFSKVLPIALLAALGTAQSINYEELQKLNSALQSTCGSIASQVSQVGSYYDSIAPSLGGGSTAQGLNEGFQQFAESDHQLQEVCAKLSEGLSQITASYQSSEDTAAQHLGDLADQLG